LVFILQNREAVTMSFLGFSIRAGAVAGVVGK
jgi:uncharacterized integral membrane protein